MLSPDGMVLFTGQKYGDEKVKLSVGFKLYTEKVKILMINDVILPRTGSLLKLSSKSRPPEKVDVLAVLDFHIPF